LTVPYSTVVIACYSPTTPYNRYSSIDNVNHCSIIIVLVVMRQGGLLRAAATGAKYGRYYNYIPLLFGRIAMLPYN